MLTPLTQKQAMMQYFACNPFFRTYLKVNIPQHTDTFLSEHGVKSRQSSSIHVARRHHPMPHLELVREAPEALSRRPIPDHEKAGVGEFPMHDGEGLQEKPKIFLPAEPPHIDKERPLGQLRILGGELGPQGLRFFGPRAKKLVVHAGGNHREIVLDPVGREHRGYPQRGHDDIVVSVVDLAHDHIDIVVPGDEAAVTHRPEEGPRVEPIPEAVLFADVMERLKKAQKDELQLAQLVLAGEAVVWKVYHFGPRMARDALTRRRLIYLSFEQLMAIPNQRIFPRADPASILLL